MGKRELKRELLDLLLEDYDVQGCIRNICQQNPLERKKHSYEQERTSSYKSEQESSWLPFRKKDNEYKAEAEQLKAKLAEREQEIEERDEQIRVLEQEVDNVKERLSHLQSENEDWRYDAARERREKENAKAELASVRSELKSLQEASARLEYDNRQLRERNEEQRKMLSRRFAKGWELFCSYQKVSEQTKQLLNGVFVKGDDFPSFICGGAQDNSLGVIWDVIKGCLSRENTADAEILWDIFAYDMELVNCTKTKRIYALLEVEEGTPFDLDVHTLAAGSRAQGTVKEVYLQGYMNVYANHVERKSIVRL